MPHGNTLSRLLIASLAAVAIMAPAAGAQPTDPVVTTQPQTDAPAGQEHRTENARDQAKAVSPSTTQELRGENAKDPSRAPAPDAKPLPGPPTWPLHPRVLTPPQATVADGGDGGGIEAPVLALLIAGTLALGGGLMAVTLRHRTRVAH